MESLHTKSSPKLWLCPLTVGRHVYLGCTRTCIRARYVEIDLSSVGWDRSGIQISKSNVGVTEGSLTSKFEV